MFTHDTIAAISSATGSAARMIVRVSGSETRDLALKLGISEFNASAAVYLPICFHGLVCPAWVYQFVAPRSYTGEDLLELHIPGNPILARMLLDWLTASGARQAEPGEFTARAYFNGKLDLSQAEGVAAIISAQSAQQLAAGRQLMAGELSRRLRPAMDELAEILALVEAGIDFSDEGIEFVSSDDVGGRIDRLDDELGKLIAESARFEKLTHEPTIVFAGRPNAGKSTLLNVLAGMRRAVVSPTAGTTRDVLSVEIALPRGIVRLTDIAGIEEEAGVGVIESQMRELAIRAAETADVLVLVRDVTDRREEIALPRAADLRVVSKIDLAPANRSAKPGAIGSCGSPPPQPSPGLPGEGERGRVVVSAKTNVGIAELTAELDRLAFSSDSSGATLALTSRHLQALHEAIAALRRAREVRKIAELLAAELRSALDALGAILGVVTPDDVLGRIFATFCIGK